jgi:hypothetical protein
MASLQNITSGITTGGFGSLALDLSPTINQYVQGQEQEQERRRRVIRANDELIAGTDLSKLSQTDLENGIKQKYADFKTLGMNDYGKDFNRHDSDLRSKHQSLQNEINTAINVRKQNMAQYDDLKPLLPPEELIRLQEDIKKPSINPDGTQNLIDATKYKLKPKDYLSVNKLVHDTVEQNTNKPENLEKVRRKDGKFNDVSGSLVNIENAVRNLTDSYTTDEKTRESVDNAVKQLNSQSPTSTPLTPEQYLQAQVEANVRAKQSDRSREQYPNWTFKPGDKTTYVNINPRTPNEYVSHTTVKVDAGGRAAEENVKLYESAYSSASRYLLGKGDAGDAAAKATKILKGASVDGGNISGVEPITNANGEKGFQVFFSDPLYGKVVEPKEYYGAQALRRLGLFYNQKQKAVAAQIVPDPELEIKRPELKPFIPRLPEPMKINSKPKSSNSATPKATENNSKKKNKASSETLSFFK